MYYRGHFLLVCATLLCFYLYAVVGQNEKPTARIPRTTFTCVGRGSGYYADMETGCQVYHMCDGLGRQFSYSCPNTTLFQQRMLICDHWYMVNCSMSAKDYDANLLIGQRNKPFVSDEEMSQRTPRPDILSVPPNSNYYDGLKEAESKFAIHPGNSIVGIADTISGGDNNGLDSAKQYYRPPSSWSTKRPSISFGSNIGPNHDIEDEDTLAGAASRNPGPTIRPIDDRRPFQTETTVNAGISNITPPSRELRPPLPPSTTEASSEEFQIDARMKEPLDPVVNFINRFDPNSPDSLNTSMTRTEIIDINKQLPEGQVSSEEDRSPRKNKNFHSNFNNVQGKDEKRVTDGSKFDNVNVKPTQPSKSSSSVPEPAKQLLPPKTDYSQLVTSTEGPPIYYEWKWAVPAFDLEPPKISNDTANITNVQKPRSTQGRSPFKDVTRPTTTEIVPTPGPKNTEYNISSYFVPDYVFPLDKPHPGYDSDDAQTSFQVGVSRPGRASFGENSACPQCHPAYVVPGTCEPCIVKR